VPIKIITKDNLKILMNKLLTDYTLIAPTKQAGNIIRYKEINKTEDIILEFYNSDVSPKEHFLPQTEKLFGFTLDEKGLQLHPPQQEQKERILFGMRPCDIKALEALDPVFDGKWKDCHYMTNRRQTIIIGIACEEVLPTCFCNAFGIDPVSQQGADVMLIKNNGVFAIEECTERGRTLINKYEKLFMRKDFDLEQIKEEKRSRLQKQFIHHISPARAKETMNQYFDLTYWDEISRKCLECGICTYICPTCHCFDIFDFAPKKTEGARYRCWDSCMYRDFTQMAGGHNPRPSKKERVRNRFMHKLKYHRDRYGIDGCVGCGRCIVKCPVNMDITRIITDLGEVV